LRARAFHNRSLWVASPDEENRTYGCDSSRHRRLGTGWFGCRDGGSSSARTVPAVVSRRLLGPGLGR
jgi:hypothetical protein